MNNFYSVLVERFTDEIDDEQVFNLQGKFAEKTLNYLLVCAITIIVYESVCFDRWAIPRLQ